MTTLPFVLAVAGIAVIVLTVEAGHVPIFALILAVTWGFYGLIKRTVPLHPVESLAAETFVLLPIALIVVLYVEAGSRAIHTSASGLQLAMVVGHFNNAANHSASLKPDSLRSPMGDTVTRLACACRSVSAVL